VLRGSAKAVRGNDVPGIAKAGLSGEAHGKRAARQGITRNCSGKAKRGMVCSGNGKQGNAFDLE